jgi:glycosyltransferase involved in cell wall biosynthesis
LAELPLARTRVSFIVPAHNEAATILEVLRRIDRLPLDTQVIVVDDGSTDETPTLLTAWQESRERAHVITQPNRGKGAAIRAAIPHIDGDIVVIQDADMEYDPADVPRLVGPITEGVADVVFGSRLSGGQPQRVHMFWHLVGNRVLSLLTNMLFNTTLSDMETGYKVFRAEVLRSLTLRQNDFGIEPEIAAQVCKRKLRIYELPIAYYGRTHDEGKKITWRDGVIAVKVLVAERLRP